MKDQRVYVDFLYGFVFKAHLADLDQDLGEGFQISCRHASNLIQDFVSFNLAHHLKGISFRDGCHPKGDILEYFREDTPQSEHHAWAELSIPGHPHHELPASFHHLLNKKALFIALERIHDMLVDRFRFLIIANVHGDETLFCFVCQAGCTPFDHQGVAYLVHRIEEVLVFTDQDLSGYRDVVSREKDF